MSSKSFASQELVGGSRGLGAVHTGDATVKEEVSEHLSTPPIITLALIVDEPALWPVAVVR